VIRFTKKPDIGKKSAYRQNAGTPAKGTDDRTCPLVNVGPPRWAFGGGNGEHS